MSLVFKPISVLLKETRNNKGISLEEVYKATKVHPKILKALEDGATLELDQVYAKSYIRIYAKFLGINQKEMEQYFHPSVREEKKQIKEPSLFRMARIETLRKLPYFSYIGFQIRKNKKNILIVLAIVLALLIISKVIKSRPVNVEGSPKQEAVVQKPVKEEKPKTKQPVIDKAYDVLRLTIYAQEDTWMQIKSDGGVVFKRILKKNNSETWEAKDEFELWLANAGTIQVELNGKILEPFGRRGQLLKSVIIDKTGRITIKK